MRLLLILLTAAAALGLAAGMARGQAPVDTDTIAAPLFPDRTSVENGYLNRFNMNREPQGARARGMGGTGLALPGGPESHAQNPAGILGLSKPQLQAEATYYSGSAGVNSFPSEIDVGATDLIDAFDYRINIRKTMYYGGISGGIPLVFLGQRSALALSYRRVGVTGFQDESRANLQGSITNQAVATYGVEDLPRDGMDDISLTLARSIMDWLDLGVNFNWMGGNLKRDGETGISVVGFQFASASTSFRQKIESKSLDVGAMVELGPLRAGGAVYLGHDLEFHTGTAQSVTLPSPPDFSHRFLIQGRPRDHTLSVPTMFGVGGSYAINDRLTVAADVLIRPWGQSEVTRSRVEAFVGFENLADSSSFFQTLIPADNDTLWEAAVNAGLITDGSNRTETFDAGLGDSNSLRLGVEYFLKKTPDFELPLRVGFRIESMTFNNLAEPLADTTYSGVIHQYWKARQVDPGCTSPECEGKETFLKKVMEFNQMMFQGEPVDASTFTLGMGVRISEWSADLTFERTSFDYDRFFLSPFDPILNPITDIAHENRTLLNVSLSMSMGF